MTFFPILPRFHAPFLFFEDFSTNPGGRHPGMETKRDRSRMDGHTYLTSHTRLLPVLSFSCPAAEPPEAWGMSCSLLAEILHHSLTDIG